MKNTKNKQTTKPITVASTYEGLPINTGKYKNLGVYPNMLKPILGQIKVLLTHHSRVQLLRFDLHLPVTEFMTALAGNQVASKFFKQIRQDLGSRNWNYQDKVIQGWTREIGESNNAHYHCYIGVSSTVRLGTFYGDTPTLLWKLIYNRWEELTGGSVRPSGHHVVNRFNHEQLSTAFYHLSYLCKARSKDFGTGEPHKRYSNSRLKPKQAVNRISINDDYHGTVCTNDTVTRFDLVISPPYSCI